MKKYLYIILILFVQNALAQSQNRGGFVKQNATNGVNVLKVSFNFELLHAAGAQESFGFFQIGKDFGSNTYIINDINNPNKLFTNFAISSNNLGQFRLVNSAVSNPNIIINASPNYSGSHKITWYVNKSTISQNYNDPSNQVVSLAPNKWILYVDKAIALGPLPNNTKQDYSTFDINDFKFGLRELSTDLLIRFDSLKLTAINSSSNLMGKSTETGALLDVEKEMKVEELNVYQRMQNLNVSFNSSVIRQTELRLMSLSGTVLHKKTWHLNTDKNETEIPVGNLAKGIYFINLSGPNLNQSKKILIN